MTALALLGKDLDQDGTAELEAADELAGQSSDSTTDAATAAAYLAASDSVLMEPLARQLLRQATTRFVYDLDAGGSPARRPCGRASSDPPPCRRSRTRRSS